MIQADELMIGNLCMRNGKLRTIDVNDISNIWDNNRLNPNNHRLDEEISNFYERIPLTEEFLTKKFTELIDKFIKGDITPEESERMEKIGDVLEEYKQDYKEKFGVYPTISSGAQAPGTFTPDKTLFQ